MAHIKSKIYGDEIIVVGNRRIINQEKITRRIYEVNN